ncbi:MAG: serine hydrolase [Saprospiraceae bacterium]|nr:serine hydrolase [Saprospiraceae bacterium]
MNTIVKKAALLVVGLSLTAALHAQNAAELAKREAWVDSVMTSFSLEEKIGQLFTIRAHSNLGPEHIAKVKREIQKYHVGGLCFFQGSPIKQINLINEYQDLSRFPLLISMDAEWGLGMRFKKDVVNYPRPLMLGAIQDNSLIYNLGAQIGDHLKSIGVHVNYGPVVDINNNPDNPVINDRSFGEDKYNVSTKGYMYMRGLQDQGVAACGKHFPGHGDTDVDSHYDLPVIPHTSDRLTDIELFPFKTLIKHGLQGMMVAHLNVPTLDPEGLPTTLSKPVVTDLLREEMDFDGVIFTDAMEMQAVAGRYENGVAESMVLDAGNDVILLPNDLPLAFETILKKVRNEDIPLPRIEASVRRILSMKHDVGLHAYTPLSNANLYQRLNSPEAISLKSELIRNSLTLVRNSRNLVPARHAYRSFGALAIGSKRLTHFQLMLDKYEKMPRYYAPHQISAKESQRLLTNLARKDVVLISIHDMSKYSSKNFGLDQTTLDLIDSLASRTEVVLSIFGSPYSLKHFDHIEHVLVAYNDQIETQRLAAQALFGAVALRGRLPVTASPRSTFGTGIDTKEYFRIGYATPEEVGMSADSLREVDRLMHEIMRRKASPGGHVLVAKEGKIVFNKSYGYHTYERKRPVQSHHLFDLASVTKITAATMAVMKLFDEGKLKLDVPIATYLPELQGTNKAGMILQDIMSHHAGLMPWIPFYKNTLDPQTNKPADAYYKPNASQDFNVPVSEDLYLRSDYPDTIWHAIVDSELRTRRDYRYSDLGFYIIARIVERVSGQPIDAYLQEHFYGPLNMRSTCYNPIDRFDAKDIVPTEKDNYFRYRTIQGEVHDMGAAMLEGISGHAGLFSNAEDLVKIYQMMLNRGFYGGRQYLSSSTIDSFTTRHKRSTRRAVGFDMKELRKSKPCNISEECSNLTFGHYGFTGTGVWIDPAQDLIFIFLSNRTFPSMKNNLLHKEDYRSKVQSAVYRAIVDKSPFTQS